jgi:uncharacterized membrane protein
MRAPYGRNRRTVQRGERRRQSVATVLPVLAGAFTVVHTIHAAAADNRWIVWNTFLALVPLAFAVVLFRDGAGARRGPLWWAGFVVWLLFLPNAPYVLTDSVHLLDDIRGASNVAVFSGYLPVYGAFFAVGFGAYVVSLRLLHRYVTEHRPHASWLVIEGVLHALCAAGIYLGRFVGLNSWDVVASPGSVTATLDDLARRSPIVIMGTTFVVIAVGTFVANAVIDKSLHAKQRLMSH